MAAAAVTERLYVGTGVCLVIEHDPIYLAKQITTIASMLKTANIVNANW